MQYVFREDGSYYTSRFRYPFAQMEVGDWFEVDQYEAKCMRSYVSTHFRGMFVSKKRSYFRVVFTRIK